MSVHTALDVGRDVGKLFPCSCTAVERSLLKQSLTCRLMEWGGSTGERALGAAPITASPQELLWATIGGWLLNYANLWFPRKTTLAAFCTCVHSSKESEKRKSWTTCSSNLQRPEQTPPCMTFRTHSALWSFICFIHHMKSLLSQLWLHVGKLHKYFHKTPLTSWGAITTGF